VTALGAEPPAPSYAECPVPGSLGRPTYGGPGSKPVIGQNHWYDNGVTLVLTLSAPALAIIGSCLPTEACAHYRCQRMSERQKQG